ncbi:hypothetical protein [Cerasicoccus maritimus]|uniref:hypothetical protein n=1 Tax=Cerasicoccus maritimus TaxID=490089 RepID=UPI0028524E8C|nr:hypothetical protein [Cerasicoccus maritimus]
MKNFIAVIALVAPLPLIHAQERVLFVGNSFTHGHNEPAVSYNQAAITDANSSNYGGVPGIFKKLTDQAGLDYEVTIEAVGGKTLDYHLTYKSAIIGSGDWDVVVLQDQSTRPLPEENGGEPAAFYSAADALMDLIQGANADTDVILYETWSSPTSATEKGYGSDLQAMQDDLQEIIFNGYYRYVRSAETHPNFTAVSRVGDAFMHAIDLGYASGDSTTASSEDLLYFWYSEDHRHASYQGSYLSALMMLGHITGIDPRTLGTGVGTAAYELGITATHAEQMHQVAYETLQFDLPAPPDPPTPNINTLTSGLSPYNWNNEANWSEGPLDATQSVLLDSDSPSSSIVANSTTGKPTYSVQSVNFDIGAATKSIQGNATVSSTRILNIGGGLDAFGGSDLIRLSDTTTGVVNFGTNSGLGVLEITPAVSGKIRVGNAEGTLRIGPTAEFAGDISLTKTGPGILILESNATWGASAGNTFTIQDGFVQADASASGVYSATGKAAVVVEASGVLGGDGQITPGSGNHIAVNGGLLSPGARDAATSQSQLGVLTLNGSLTDEPLLQLDDAAALVFDLDSDGPTDLQCDQIDLTSAQASDVVLSGNAFDFNVLSSSLLPDGDYPLITADAADAFTGLTIDGDGYITGGASIGEGLEDYQAQLKLSGNNLVLELTQLPYAQWRQNAFTPEELADPAISGDEASPANDGMSNLIKYAFGLDDAYASARSRQPWVQTLLVEGVTTPVFCFLRNINASDLIYVVEVSDNLSVWYSGDSYTSQIDEIDNEDSATRTIFVQPANGYSFVRLNVTRN